MRTSARAVLIVVAVAILPSCAGGPSPSDTGDIPKDVPDIARIVCTQEGTRVETATIRPRLDGVHVLIDNQLGFDTGFSTRYENGAGEGDNAPTGGSEHVLAAPPGTLEIGCYGDPDEASDLEAILVVDPTGIYRSTELDCDATVQGISDYAEGATGYVGELMDIARIRLDQAIQLHDDDAVEFAGYPEDALRTVFDSFGTIGWLRRSRSPKADKAVGSRTRSRDAMSCPSTRSAEDADRMTA
jgi:hypothetical protein